MTKLLQNQSMQFIAFPNKIPDAPHWDLEMIQPEEASDFLKKISQNILQHLEV